MGKFKGVTGAQHAQRTTTSTTTNTLQSSHHTQQRPRHNTNNNDHAQPKTATHTHNHRASTYEWVAARHFSGSFACACAPFSRSPRRRDARSVGLLLLLQLLLSVMCAVRGSISKRAQHTHAPRRVYRMYHRPYLCEEQSTACDLVM